MSFSQSQGDHKTGGGMRAAASESRAFSNARGLFYNVRSQRPNGGDMSNHELATSIATIVNVGARVLSSAITAYQAFRKTNVERYFEGLLKASEEGLDLSQIGESEELERLFFSFLDKVAAEANQEKIDAWKNATIHLATDFRDFD